MSRSHDAPKTSKTLRPTAQGHDAAPSLDRSHTADASLVAEGAPYWERWNEANREAIDHYNVRVEREGLPLARYRTFAKA